VLRAGLAASAAAALAAGCGGHVSSGPTTLAKPAASTPAVCRALALAAVDDARGLLRAYKGDASPGDLAMYDLREHLAYLQQNRCRPALLGDALRSKISPQETEALVVFLPTTYGRDLRQAVACSRGRRSPERCTAAVAVIALPGATEPGHLPHPLVP
jgi:hypothetical protein